MNAMHEALKKKLHSFGPKQDDLALAIEGSPSEEANESMLDEKKEQETDLAPSGDATETHKELLANQQVVQSGHEEANPLHHKDMAQDPKMHGEIMAALMGHGHAGRGGISLHEKAMEKHNLKKR